MRAGRLRHRLDFESPNTAVDSYGEATLEPWTLSTILWGSLEPLSGRELIAAQQAQAETTHRVRVRYEADIVPTMRISYGGRYFQILSIINREERGRELEIMCKELS